MIAWDAEKSLGWDMVDGGQQLVIEVANRLNSADAATCAAVTEAALEALEARLVRQFQAEESFLAAQRSPVLAERRKQHQALLNTLSALRVALRAGHDVRSRLLMTLVAFLRTHLRSADPTDLAPPEQCARAA